MFRSAYENLLRRGGPASSSVDSAAALPQNSIFTPAWLLISLSAALFIPGLNVVIEKVGATAAFFILGFPGTFTSKAGMGKYCFYQKKTFFFFEKQNMFFSKKLFFFFIFLANHYLFSCCLNKNDNFRALSTPRRDRSVP